MEGRDLYLRYQGPSGSSHIRQHRVWDAERFFVRTLENHAKEEPPTLVTVATPEEYRRENWKRK